MTELPRGVYEHVVTHDLRDQLAQIDGDLVSFADLDPADSHEILSKHLAKLAARALRSVGGQGGDLLRAQVDVANRIAEAIATVAPRRSVHEGDFLTTPELLTAVVPRPPAPRAVHFPERPQVPLGNGALLTNGRGQPTIGSEVVKEMASADRVDLLCAFIKHRGVHLVQGAIRDLHDRGGRLRVITTTYMGATEQRALDELARLGAEIRISYETRTTRLHAKAWLFRRESGASTAYVGSSNLSRSALVDGKEWNVRLSALEQPAVLDTFAFTFEDYWNDPTFEPYDPANPEDAGRLASALRVESRSDAGRVDFSGVEVRPYPYQQEILEGLDSERTMHGRHRNLVVMATGTGKTVVAGLDYRRLRRAGIDNLLFIAHQHRILEQSQRVFRHVLGDGQFGELFVGGHQPRDWRHVFASVQSLHRFDLSQVDPAQFDMVIVDEFHHAEAATYQRLLRTLQPKILLGLTATPERADGQDIRHWFDGHTAVELRLWEALERQLLAPFQYFGIHDDVDLRQLEWKRGRGYETTALNSVYTGNDARVQIILRTLAGTTDAQMMRALGFCVSIDHANYMTDRFIEAGIPAMALHSGVRQEDREQAISRLTRGELKILFTVDLFNEGIDLPSVDTLLLLRPTESATIFLQQLGRGLRLSDDKPYLTVFDFIGAQHARFRFDRRYQALTGVTRRRLITDIQEDFPYLPAGCHIQLDRIAKEIVLRNVQHALRRPYEEMIQDLRQLGDVNLATFLDDTGFEIEDVYRRRGRRGWTGLRERAAVVPLSATTNDIGLSAAIGRLLHLDDPDRIDVLRKLADGSAVPGRLGAMVRRTLFGAAPEAATNASLLAQSPHRQEEIRQLADVLQERIHRVTTRLPNSTSPLRVHARYNRNEACIGLGLDNPQLRGEGVKWIEEEKAVLFFVTLIKTEKHYSVSTMYQDRAITEELFQWESQSQTAEASKHGQRYVNHVQLGWSVHLFVRETQDEDGDLGRPSYLYAGPMTYVQHTGERPMRILWKLTHPLPADVFHAARLAA